MEAKEILAMTGIVIGAIASVSAICFGYDAARRKDLPEVVFWMGMLFILGR